LDSYKPFNDVWKSYGDFVNPAFKRIWPDDDYQYGMCIYEGIPAVEKGPESAQHILSYCIQLHCKGT